MWRSSDPYVAFLLFLFVYITHASSFVIQSTDSMWTLPTAVSLVREGNFDLNEYRKLIKERKKYGIRIRPKRKIYYNFFPYGTSLLVVPAVAVYEMYPEGFSYLVPGARKKLAKREDVEKPHSAMDIRLELERALASLLVALCAVLWYSISRRYLSSGLSFMVVLAFCFGTPAWSTASRGLWQHGPVMLLYSITLWLLLKKKDRSSFAAFPLAFGYIVRPTTSVVWFFTLVYSVLRSRWNILKYVGLSAIPFAAFFLINRRLYGRYLPPYYRPGRLGYHDGFFEALAANLFSPSRGLLFQSPFLLFALTALIVFLRPSNDRKIVGYCVLCTGAHVVLTSLFPNWWHGHSFGSRYMADILPFFLLLIVIGFSHFRSLLVQATFVVLVFLSIPIHYAGVRSYRPYLWNKHPVNIDERPSRVWSLSDPQFLR